MAELSEEPPWVAELRERVAADYARDPAGFVAMLEAFCDNDDVTEEEWDAALAESPPPAPSPMEQEAGNG